ncbi:MAG: TonB-dependent receptor, partial [candidate division WOR-3 bacterium]
MRLLTALCLLVTGASAAVISGYTREATTGEPLAFVNVYLKDGSLGTVSDRTGYYLLANVPAGRQQVSFSMVGYQTLDTTLVFSPDRPLRFDARLKPEPIQVGEVTVSAQRQRFNREIDLGVRRLDTRDLQIAPGFIEQDLFKSLQLLPGVVSISDLASALYVRGGSPDQNAVLLDGVPIYNPYHLGGLFSTFNLDAINAAELNSGAFPAQFGGGVSSVLDVEMREGNTERYTGKWDLGLLTTKGVFEGPLPKGSFLVAGRRTYIDALTWTIGRLFRHPEYHLPYYFYDLQAKANFDISDRDRLTISGFIGDDIINIADSTDEVDFRWGNYTLAARHRHIFSPQLLLTTLLTNGRNRVGLDAESRFGGDTSRMKLSMSINDIGLRQDL